MAFKNLSKFDDVTPVMYRIDCPLCSEPNAIQVRIIKGYDSHNIPFYESIGHCTHCGMTTPVKSNWVPLSRENELENRAIFDILHWCEWWQ